MQSVKRWVKKHFGSFIFRRLKSSARKEELEYWLTRLNQSPLPVLSDASYNVFTYHGEDGILLYLLSQLQDFPKTFVDIGAGDCIKGNFSTLVVHYGWEGVFIDQNQQQLEVGRHFYKWKTRKGLFLKFLPATVTKDNVNNLIRETGMNGKIGMLSIDIDGNDYWIWDAIDVIQPQIVIIEAKVEFGNKSITVPYGTANHHTVDEMFNGASVEALRKLGVKKGYKLAGANKQGYNLFFVRRDAGNIPETTAEQVLNNSETKKSFYPESFFSNHKFKSI